MHTKNQFKKKKIPKFPGLLIDKPICIIDDGACRHQTRNVCFHLTFLMWRKIPSLPNLTLRCGRCATGAAVFQKQLCYPACCYVDESCVYSIDASV